MDWQDKVENGILLFMVGVIFLICVFAIYTVFECLIHDEVIAITATIISIIALIYAYKKSL